MSNPITKGAFGRIAVFALLGVIGVWLVYDLVDAVSYFAQDYRRLRLVGLAVMVGAPLLLIFQLLSVPWRQRIGSWILGIVACGVTGLAVYVLHSCWRLRDVFTEDGGGSLLMALVCLMVSGYAAWFWWLAWDLGHKKPTA